MRVRVIGTLFRPAVYFEQKVEMLSVTLAAYCGRLIPHLLVHLKSWLQLRAWLALALPQLLAEVVWLNCEL
jgi:hypothetical protein